jgi:cytochrome c peroxidase
MTSAIVLLATLLAAPGPVKAASTKAAAPAKAAACPLTDEEQLGKKLFNPPLLSANGNQSCATCHSLAHGGTGPASAIEATGAVYEGSIPGAFGNRRPSSITYAGDSPPLALVEKDGQQEWACGSFWDGRATGKKLGDPLAEQALGPFLNPAEQALPDAAAVVSHACGSGYAALLKKVLGASACAKESAEKTFEGFGRAIAAWERSSEVSPFTSKYDGFLAGTVALTPTERQGLALFEGKARCSTCHPSRPREGGKPPLFTDFGYDNVGLPRNPMNPWYSQRAANTWGSGWVDFGLGGELKAAGRPPAEYEPWLGKFKVPSLRNVDRRPGPYARGVHVKAYGHNGALKSLEEIVHFYNARDVERVRWAPPEYPPTVNRKELGNLGLGADDEADLVAFLRTLSDGFLKPTCAARGR